MGCAPARYCSRTTTFCQSVMLAVTRNIWSGLWFFSFPSSIDQPFFLNLWCSHRKGVNTNRRIQPLHTDDCYNLLMFVLESTWTTDLAPDGPPSSESFFFLRGTQTDTLEVLFLAMAGRRDCVLEADTCQSWQLRILARFFPPMCSALVRLRITSHAEDLLTTNQPGSKQGHGRATTCIRW